MASRCRRYRPRRLQALKDNPELLVIRPSPPSAGLNDLQPFNLSTVLMAVHKHCYISLKRTQQGGPRRRETSKPTFYRKLDGGAARIAAILGERGVVVR